MKMTLQTWISIVIDIEPRHGHLARLGPIRQSQRRIFSPWMWPGREGPGDSVRFLCNFCTSITVAWGLHIGQLEWSWAPILRLRLSVGWERYRKHERVTNYQLLPLRYYGKYGVDSDGSLRFFEASPLAARVHDPSNDVMMHYLVA